MFSTLAPGQAAPIPISLVRAGWNVGEGRGEHLCAGPSCPGMDLGPCPPGLTGKPEQTSGVWSHWLERLARAGYGGPTGGTHRPSQVRTKNEETEAREGQRLQFPQGGKTERGSCSELLGTEVGGDGHPGVMSSGHVPINTAPYLPIAVVDAEERGGWLHPCWPGRGAPSAPRSPAPPLSSQR